jgi:DNA-binding MarR family transcriptional regulator
MEDDTMNFIKINSNIFRSIQTYLDKVLKKYELSSGSFRYLFVLEKNEGISQNKISKEIGNDKAMSARTITKLIELKYVYKEEDAKDNRAYNLYLTAKAKEVIPKIREEIHTLVDIVTEELSEEEKSTTMNSLKVIYDKTKRLNRQGED